MCCLFLGKQAKDHRKCLHLKYKIKALKTKSLTATEKNIYLKDEREHKSTRVKTILQWVSVSVLFVFSYYSYML